jgi:hypothetical protein
MQTNLTEDPFGSPHSYCVAFKSPPKSLTKQKHAGREITESNLDRNRKEQFLTGFLGPSLMVNRETEIAVRGKLMHGASWLI